MPRLVDGNAAMTSPTSSISNARPAIARLDRRAFRAASRFAFRARGEGVVVHAEPRESRSARGHRRRREGAGDRGRDRLARTPRSETTRRDHPESARVRSGRSVAHRLARSGVQRTASAARARSDPTLAAVAAGTHCPLLAEAGVAEVKDFARCGRRLERRRAVVALRASELSAFLCRNFRKARSSSPSAYGFEARGALGFKVPTIGCGNVESEEDLFEEVRALGRLQRPTEGLPPVALGARPSEPRYCYALPKTCWSAPASTKCTRTVSTRGKFPSAWVKPKASAVRPTSDGELARKQLRVEKTAWRKPCKRLRT